MEKNNNIIKIGQAAKYRGAYRNTATYYAENIVTMYGCVFSCKKAKVTGKAPVAVVDAEAGFIDLDNADVWEVLVDSINFYNRALDGVPFDTQPIHHSSNGITSGAVWTALQDAMSTMTANLNEQVRLLNKRIEEKVEEGTLDIAETAWDKLSIEQQDALKERYVTIYIYEDDAPAPEPGGSYDPATRMITVKGGYTDGMLQAGGTYDPTTGLLTI